MSRAGSWDADLTCPQAKGTARRCQHNWFIPAGWGQHLPSVKPSVCLQHPDGFTAFPCTRSTLPHTACKKCTRGWCSIKSALNFHPVLTACGKPLLAKQLFGVFFCASHSSTTCIRTQVLKKSRNLNHAISSQNACCVFCYVTELLHLSLVSWKEGEEDAAKCSRSVCDLTESQNCWG